MRRARLQSLTVSHHGFDGIGDVGAGEFFGVGFFAGDYRDGGIGDREVGVDVEHLAGFGFGFFAGGVGGVAFLPVELQRAEEELGAKFPPDYAVPLVHQDGQVAVRLDPLRPHVADDGFRRWAQD